MIVKEALANGRLTERSDGEAPRPPQERSQLHARRQSMRVALAAALSQPWADVVLSGAVTTEQLESNLKAVVLAAGTRGLAGHRRITDRLLGATQRPRLAVSSRAVQLRAQHRYTDDVVSLRRLSTHAPRAASRLGGRRWRKKGATPGSTGGLSLSPSRLSLLSSPFSWSVEVVQWFWPPARAGHGQQQHRHLRLLENNTFVTNVEVIAREYQAHTGRPLDDDSSDR